MGVGVGWEWDGKIAGDWKEKDERTEGVDN